MSIDGERLRLVIAVTLLATLAGCDRGDRPLDDDEKIVRATLRLLASDGQPICADGRTYGQPLAVYRTMSVAPLETRRMLAWRPPAPLRPPQEPSAEAIYRDSMEQGRVRLKEPSPAESGLPPLERSRLDGIAQTLSIQGRPQSTGIEGTWGGANVITRWWPFNRIRSDCTPRFVVTDPVRSRDTAFVTVTAGHWGTLYALEKRGEDWQPYAEWSRWLY